MWLVTFWQLLWEIWMTAPGCSCESKQGRRECKCNRETR
jgi:hypothetical protein